MRLEPGTSRGLSPQWAAFTTLLTSFGRRAQLGVFRLPVKPLKQHADAPPALPKLLLGSSDIATTSASTRDGTRPCGAIQAHTLLQAFVIAVERGALLG